MIGLAHCGDKLGNLTKPRLGLCSGYHYVVYLRDQLVISKWYASSDFLVWILYLLMFFLLGVTSNAKGLFLPLRNGILLKWSL